MYLLTIGTITLYKLKEMRTTFFARDGSISFVMYNFFSYLIVLKCLDVLIIEQIRFVVLFGLWCMISI